MDQGAGDEGTSSCVGHATSGCGTTALAAAGTPLPWVWSPDGIYKNARAVDRTPNPDGTLPPLEDGGAQPNQAMRALGEWGVRPMRGPTSDGRNSDVEKASVNDEPKLGELEDEGATLIVGEYAITSTGKERVREMQTALANGKPFTAAIAASGDAFQGYTSGVLGPLGTDLDHYVYFDGYETADDGSIVFHGVNSWGTGWGESGRFRLHEAGVAELGDVVVFDIRLMKGNP